MAKVAAFKPPPDPPPTGGRVYTFAEAMQYLHIARTTLRNYVALREIEFIRFGSEGRRADIRFTQAALDRFLAKHTIAARD